MADRDEKQRRDGVPWTRLMVAALLVAPALFRGGTWPWLLPGLLVIAAGTSWRLLGKVSRARAPIEVGLLLLLAVVVLVPVVPWPPSLTRLLAPQLHEAVNGACQLSCRARLGQESDVAAFCLRPRPLSPVPAGGITEAARLVFLALVLVIGGSLRWRFVAAIVAAAGTLQALIALIRGTLSSPLLETLLSSADRPVSASLLGTFINPNHQAALHALATFCSIALLADAATGPERTKTQIRAREQIWLFSATAAINLGLVAASLSRAAIVLALVGLLASIAVLGRTMGSVDKERVASLRGALFVSLGVLFVPVLVGLRRGAWREVLTLLPGEISGAAIPQTQDLDATAALQAQETSAEGWGGSGVLDDKLQHLYEGIGALELSPWVGVGRGAYVHTSQLVGRVSPDGSRSASGIVYAQLESTPLQWWVETGPLGALIVIVLASLLLLRALRSSQSGRDAARSSRLVIIVGLGMLGVHSLVEVPLEGCGLAPLTICLLGSLGRGDSRLSRPWPRSASIAIPVLAALAAAAALIVLPHLPTRARARSLYEGSLAPSASQSQWLPLDPDLHLALARQASEQQQWAACRNYAELAALFASSRVEPQLQRMRCAWAQGDSVVATEALAVAVASMARGSGQVPGRRRYPPDLNVMTWIVRHVPADVLDEVMADNEETWVLISTASLGVDAAYARELAVARHSRSSVFLPAYAVRIRAELELDDPVAAVHFARELIRKRGITDESALLLARALIRRGRGDDLTDARLVLREALARDAAQPDVLEETLIATSRRQPPLEHEELEALCNSLLSRQTDRLARSRRIKLCDELR